MKKDEVLRNLQEKSLFLLKCIEEECETNKNPVSNSIRKLVLDGFEKKNLKSSKKILNEIVQWADFLTEHSKQKILEKYGDDFFKKGESKKTIEIVLEKGKIDLKNEYRAVLNFVDNYFDKKKEQEKIEILSRFLFEFEKINDSQSGKGKSS